MDAPYAAPRCATCRDAHPPPAFSMAFQPIVDVKAGRIVAYEALVRGLDGSGARSVLSQVMAENRYSFDQACRVRAIELASRLGMQARLSINFMPNAVYNPRACIRATLEAAARTGFPHDRITFEIMEGEDVADTPHLLRIIAEYRRRGFLIALDDFGVGFSGLSWLADLRPDIVKLDRELVRGCDQSADRRAILRAVAELCRAMEVQLIVEGVETAAELAVVQQAGVR